MELSEEYAFQLQKLLAENPVDRPNWQQVIDTLKNFAVASETEAVQVAFRSSNGYEILDLLNSSNPIFAKYSTNVSSYVIL